MDFNMIDIIMPLRGNKTMSKTQLPAAGCDGFSPEVIRGIPLRRFRLLPVVLFVFLTVFPGSQLYNQLEVDAPRKTGEKKVQADISVPPPPFSEDIFPCSECHDAEWETNKKRRVLEEHEDILLRHDEKNRWCLDCHDAVNRDKLHLADGRLVDFTESYKLCGQCHGPKLRDWRKGIHGRRTGYWNGPRKYLLCAHCHDPHAPRFKPVKPEPAPRRYKQKKKPPSRR
jgi:cytochrome c553